MGRPLRTALGGLIYHVLNRGNGRMQIFNTDSDYNAFENVIAQACERVPMRILSYSVMPNHWHMVLWPQQDGDLSRFVNWLTLTHTQRWHAHRHSAGSGHLYQGRFKSFIVQRDEYLLTVCCYVERNAVRADLVERAENWRWSSLWRRQFGDFEAQSLLSDWPLERPANWLAKVNTPEREEDLKELRQSVNRSQPFGNDEWLATTAQQRNLRSTVRARGRPQKYLGRKGS